MNPQAPSGRQPIAWLSTVKDALSALQSAFTIAAILAAGLWFLLQGQNHPKLKIEHRISHRVMAKSSNQLLVGVDVLLSNVGNVKLQLNCGHLKLFDVNPGDASGKARMIWPTATQNACLDAMRIEPGEGDQIHEEIPISADIRTLRVRTFFENLQASVKGDGWEYTSLYDIQTQVHPEVASTTPQPTTSSAPTASH